MTLTRLFHVLKCRRQSHRYLEGALWSIQRLPFALFSNTCRYLLWLEPLPRSIELSNEQNHYLCEGDFSSCTCVHTWAALKLHCFSELFTVSESSLGFTIPTVAKWSFLQSLQIPVNSQALTLGNALQWLSHFLEYLSPQITFKANYL